MQNTGNLDALVTELLSEIETELGGGNSADHAHAFCPICYPDLRPGQLIATVCGAKENFGHRRDVTSGCVVCDDLCDAVTLPCGHPGERPAY